MVQKYKRQETIKMMMKSMYIRVQDNGQKRSAREANGIDATNSMRGKQRRKCKE
jgi:hypothetical protein